MQTVKVPINSKPYKNVDQASLSSLSDELINGYMDESGSSIRFPGLTLFCDLGTGSNTGVKGIFWFDLIKKFVVVADGRTFTIDDKFGNFTEITGHTFQKDNLVSFADNGVSLVMANGKKMATTTGTSLTTIADTDAPIKVTHVAYLDSYILAINQADEKMYYSNVSDPTAWEPLDLVSAEGLPDNLVAMAVQYREIHLFGKDSLEVFFDDGSTPFIRLSGGFIERGCSAPYSVAKANNTMFWLDNDKRVVQLEGRTPKILSTPFDKLIAGFSTVSDAQGLNLTIDGRHFYILTFPTQNITLCYDYFLDTWSRLGQWNSSTNVFDRWIGNVYGKSLDWNLDLIGSWKDGKIYKIDSTSYVDANSGFLTMLRSTGHINHGTSRWKLSGRLTLRFKRGEGAGGTDPLVLVRYRDNGSIQWSNYLEGSLGQLGDTEFFVTFEPMGTYKTRQYEIVMSDTVPFVLVDAEEDVEVQA